MLLGGTEILALAGAFQPVWRQTIQTNEIANTRLEWFDAKRERTIPVKIYAPVGGGGPFPVVLFSHGLGGSREAYVYLGEYWSAHGYVVVHLQHSGSDEGVWREVGVGERMAAMRQAVKQPVNAVERVADVGFVLAELERLNAQDPKWLGKLDLARVGMAGHSFGAHTTLAVAGVSFAPAGRRAALFPEARIKAALPMSAPAPTVKTGLATAYGKIKIPCFHMTGTADDSPIGETTAAERRLAFDHSHNSPQYLLTFAAGDHAVFGGRPRRSGGQRDAEYQALIRLSSLAFWDAYLRDDGVARAWLQRDFAAALGPAGVFEQKFPSER